MRSVLIRYCARTLIIWSFAIFVSKLFSPGYHSHLKTKNIHNAIKLQVQLASLWLEAVSNFLLHVANNLLVESRLSNHSWFVPSRYFALSFLAVGIACTSSALWNFLPLCSCKELFWQFFNCLMRFPVLN